MSEIEQQLRQLERTNLREVLSHPACPYDLFAKHIEAQYELIRQNPQFELWALAEPESFQRAVVPVRIIRALHALHQVVFHRAFLLWLFAQVEKLLPLISEKKETKAQRLWSEVSAWLTGEKKSSAAFAEKLLASKGELDPRVPYSAIIKSPHRVGPYMHGASVYFKMMLGFIQQREMLSAALSSAEKKFKIAQTKENDASRVGNPDELWTGFKKYLAEPLAEDVSESVATLSQELRPFIEECKRNGFAVASYEEGSGFPGDYDPARSEKCKTFKAKLKTLRAKTESDKEALASMRAVLAQAQQLSAGIERYRRACFRYSRANETRHKVEDHQNSTKRALEQFDRVKGVEKCLSAVLRSLWDNNDPVQYLKQLESIVELLSGPEVLGRCTPPEKAPPS